LRAKKATRGCMQGAGAGSGNIFPGPMWQASKSVSLRLGVEAKALSVARHGVNFSPF